MCRTATKESRNKFHFMKNILRRKGNSWTETRIKTNRRTMVRDKVLRFPGLNHTNENRSYCSTLFARPGFV